MSWTEIAGSKYHFADQVLFKNIPSAYFGLCDYFTHDKGIAGIGDVIIDGVSEEIETCYLAASRLKISAAESARKLNVSPSTVSKGICRG